MPDIKPGSFYIVSDNDKVDQSKVDKNEKQDKFSVSDALTEIYNQILQKIRIRPKVTLYIGCGYDKTAASKIPGRVINIDQDSKCIEAFVKEGYEAICTPFDKFFLNQPVDLIILMNSLSIDQKMTDMLKPGGLILWYHWNYPLLKIEKKEINRIKKGGQLKYMGKIDYVNIFKKE